MSPKHYLSLDWLRGVAALSVLIFHRRWTVPGGPYTHVEHAWLAVDFFFILSGVVIAHAYADRLRRGWFWPFVGVRAIRLYPMILLGGALGAISISLDGLTWREVLAAAANSVGLPAQEPEPFYVNGPVWSLFFEIIVNLLFAAIAPWLSNRILLACIGLSGAIWLQMLCTQGMAVGFTQGTLGWGVARAMFPFLLGVGLFRLHRRGVRVWCLGYPLMTAAILAIFAIPVLPWEQPYAGFAIAVAFPLVILSGLGESGGGNWSRLAGALSYPIYILHFPIYRLLDYALDALGLGNKIEVLVGAPLICVLAWIALKYIDEPVRAALSRPRPEIAREP